MILTENQVKQLKAAKNCGTAASSAEVQAVPSGGRKKKIFSRKDLSNDLQKDIKVYPNPSTGIVNIQLPTNGNWLITATDIEGRVVWEHECSGCSGIIKHNFEGSKGLYFVKIINTVSGQETVQKIILQ